MSQDQIFANVKEAAIDPILGLNEAYTADPRDNKVNLTIGVLINENGQVCAPNIVKQAMQEILVTCQEKPNYLPMSGYKPYCELAGKLIFRETYNKDRIVSIQSVGGTGALRIISDFIKNNLAASSTPEIYVSNPTWSNHKDVFATSGFTVKDYNYYSAATKSFDLNACLESLDQIPAGSYILLHASSHNPTGCDPSQKDWNSIIEIIKSKGLIPVLDCAYQGLGLGIDEDVYSIKLLMQEGLPFFVAQSFSKSLGLYSQRTGAAHFVLCDSKTQKAVSSQAAITVRKMFSNPPAFGAYVAEKVLGNADYCQKWEAELTSMRERLINLRAEFVQKLNERNLGVDFSFIKNQTGLFAYTGLNQKQAEFARDKHAVYLLNSGRICVAALNKNNLDHVVSVIASSFEIK